MSSLAAVANSGFVNRAAKPNFYGPESVERTYQRPAYWQSPAARHYPAAAPATVMGGGETPLPTIITLASLIASTLASLSALTALIIVLIARGGGCACGGGCARGGCCGGRACRGCACRGGGCACRGCARGGGCALLA
jgi:hypothetical protein